MPTFSLTVFTFFTNIRLEWAPDVVDMVIADGALCGPIGCAGILDPSIENHTDRLQQEFGIIGLFAADPAIDIVAEKLQQHLAKLTVLRRSLPRKVDANSRWR